MWSAHWPLYDSPAHKLLQAVTSLWNKDGDIAIRGVEDFTWTLPEEQKHWDILTSQFDPEADLKLMNISRFRAGKEGKELYNEFLWGPVLNLGGIVSGQTGERFSSIFPQSATAKFDFRFGPPMTIAKAEELIRKHLDDSGFGMVELKVIGGLEPGKSPVDHPVVKAAVKATEDCGAQYRILPIHRAGNPTSHFCRQPFNLAMACGSLGIWGRGHMPNEFASLMGMRSFMTHTVRVLDEFSKLDSIPKIRMKE
jgi:acetylornithine deacetylase/succinyl-diaminopimelate desuccinylase-like protein